MDVSNKHIVHSVIAFIFLAIPSKIFAQEKAKELGLIVKKLSKADKKLSKEFSSFKHVPAKTFILQEHEGYDSLSFYLPQKVTTNSFYISPYEVSNGDYREFVKYVQDSILKKLLGYVKQGKDGNEYLDRTKKIDSKLTVKYIQQLFDSDSLPYDSLRLNYKINNNKIWLKPNYLIYNYKQNTKKVKTQVEPNYKRTKREYHYGEPYALPDYFYHPAFNDYPVVGVSFFQAQAYCHWKTQEIKIALGDDSEWDVIVTLPTLHQWEAAAVIEDKIDSTQYINSKQIAGLNVSRRHQNKPIKSNIKHGLYYDCNFSFITDKNGYLIKHSGDDGEEYTANVKSYKPNQYGLYNMKGNVAEWTTTNGDECFSQLTEYFSKSPSNYKNFTDSIKMKNTSLIDFSMPFDSILLKLQKTKIVKGGSCESAPFYIQPGVNEFYIPATQNAAIGFRCIYLIRNKKKNYGEN